MWALLTLLTLVLADSTGAGPDWCSSWLIELVLVLTLVLTLVLVLVLTGSTGVGRGVCPDR